MKSGGQNRGNPLKIQWLGTMAGAAIALTPLGAHAQSAEPSLSLPALAAPANGPLNFNPPPAVVSWVDMVSATQAAQPNWMTPLGKEAVFDKKKWPIAPALRVSLGAAGGLVRRNRHYDFQVPGGDKLHPEAAWPAPVVRFRSEPHVALAIERRLWRALSPSRRALYRRA